MMVKVSDDSASDRLVNVRLDFQAETFRDRFHASFPLLRIEWFLVACTRNVSETHAVTQSAVCRMRKVADFVPATSR